MARQRRVKKRHWCFTSFLEVLPTVYDPSVVRYCCFQREISPETKRTHFQGYLEFYDSQRMGKVKSILGECHVEPRLGSRTEAREYCRKEESAINDSFREFGIWREDVSRKRKLCDMLKTNMTLNELIDESPISFVRYHKGLEKLFARRTKAKASAFRHVHVSVYVGPTGTGKTKKACETPDHYKLPCGDKLWFDGYAGEDCLILDDFYGNIKYGTLLQILDGYEMQVAVKGGFVWAQWTKVIITSNEPPDEWYSSKFPLGASAPLMRRITEVIKFPEVDVDTESE